MYIYEYIILFSIMWIRLGGFDVSDHHVDVILVYFCLARLWFQRIVFWVHFQSEGSILLTPWEKTELSTMYGQKVNSSGFSFWKHSLQGEPELLIWNWCFIRENPTGIYVCLFIYLPAPPIKFKPPLIWPIFIALNICTLFTAAGMKIQFKAAFTACW